jgi:HlyD family secretion protein
MKRWLTLLIVLVALGGLGALSIPTWAWLQERNAPQYLKVKLSRGRVETLVNSTGTIKPVRTVSVGAFTSGPIQEIYVDYNSPITEKDQVLALIDPKLLQATVDRDRAAVATMVAELERVKALLEQSQINEVRAGRLAAVNRDYISATEMDNFRFSTKTLIAQVDLARANVLQAEANLTNSEQNLTYTRILGPKEISPERRGLFSRKRNAIKGKVIERKVDPGQTVAASFQTPELFTIALEMDQHMHLYASVDEADIGKIHIAKLRQDMDLREAGASTVGLVGSPLGQGPLLAASAHVARPSVVRFTVDAYPVEVFYGTIHDIRMNSTTTQNVVTYPVIIDAPNLHQKLMPGLTASITFQIEAKEDVLRIPASALRFTPLAAQVREEDRHYLEAIMTVPSGAAIKRSADEKANMALSRHKRVVWVQDNNLLLRAVPITLGLIENQFAEVVDGKLTEGQEIVTGVLQPR